MCSLNLKEKKKKDYEVAATNVEAIDSTNNANNDEEDSSDHNTLEIKLVRVGETLKTRAGQDGRPR